jgi:hypothetical protein
VDGLLGCIERPVQSDPRAGNINVTEQEMRKRLEVLRIEHRDLDAAIEALDAAGSTDQLQIARLKKRKLKLRDQISLIEDRLIPDIIA